MDGIFTSFGMMGSPIATRVWFDPRLGGLSVEIDGVVASIDFTQISEDDFESKTPVTQFRLGAQGSVVICSHQDGTETWLPVDIWLPDGFTPHL